MHLSALLGRPVRDASGTRIGTLADVVVALDAPFPRATALLVRDGRRLARASWSDVTSLGPAAVELRAAPAPDGHRGAGELRLARDVLDAQVIDVSGRRVRRVADVLLAGRGGDLDVIGVDAGFAAVLRRLGLGRAARGRRAAVIDWRQLHIASGPGHAVQLASPAAAVHRLGPRELAGLLAALPPARGREVLEHVEPPRAEAARALVRRRPHRHRFPHRGRRRAHA